MTERQRIAMPTINLNGDSGEALITQRTDTMKALWAAQEALAQMTPHGRNYIGDTEKYQAARKLHMERQARLAELYLEIEAEAMALADIVFGGGA